MNKTETDYHFSVALNNANISEAKDSFNKLVESNNLTSEMAETLRERASSNVVRVQSSKFLEKPTALKVKLLKLFFAIILIGGIVYVVNYFITKPEAGKDLTSTVKSEQASQPSTKTKGSHNLKVSGKAKTADKIPAKDVYVDYKDTPEYAARAAEIERIKKLRDGVVSRGNNYFGDGTFEESTKTSCEAKLVHGSDENSGAAYTGEFQIKVKFIRATISDVNLIKIEDDGRRVYEGKWKSSQTHRGRDATPSDFIMIVDKDDFIDIKFFKESAHFEAKEIGHMKLQSVILQGC